MLRFVGRKPRSKDFSVAATIWECPHCGRAHERRDAQMEELQNKLMHASTGGIEIAEAMEAFIKALHYDHSMRRVLVAEDNVLALHAALDQYRSRITR